MEGLLIAVVIVIGIIIVVPTVLIAGGICYLLFKAGRLIQRIIREEFEK